MYREPDQLSELRAELDRIRSELATIKTAAKAEPKKRTRVSFREHGVMREWVLFTLFVLTLGAFFLACGGIVTGSRAAWIACAVVCGTIAALLWAALPREVA
jgi:hypothetical protein